MNGSVGGFDFLGYHFSPAGLSVAKKTIENFIEKAFRLYEQKRRTVSSAAALEMDARRWCQWACAALVSSTTAGLHAAMMVRERVDRH